MREFLEGLNLDKSTVDLIMGQYGENVNNLKSKLKEAEEKVKDLEIKSKEVLDIEKLKKEQFDAGKAEGCKELETYKKSVALKKALGDSKAKDVKILEGLINKDNLVYKEKEDEYEIDGLNTQLEDLKKSHEYLFDIEEKKEKEQERISTGEWHEKEVDPAGFNFGFTHIHEDKK